MDGVGTPVDEGGGEGTGLGRVETAFQTWEGTVWGRWRQTGGGCESGSGGLGVQGDSRAWKASERWRAK